MVELDEQQLDGIKIDQDGVLLVRSREGHVVRFRGTADPGDLSVQQWLQAIRAAVLAPQPQAASVPGDAKPTEML